MRGHLGRLGPFVLPVSFALLLFVGAAVIGYVYSHEPARDTLEVEFEGTPEPGPSFVTGVVESIDGDVVHIATGAGGRVEVRVGPQTPIEALVRLQELLPEGAMVNVGVDETSFGQVLSGVVAVEGAE